ncbi:hypothetical protein [Streptomyces sp. YKOK-I1]
MRRTLATRRSGSLSAFPYVVAAFGNSGGNRRGLFGPYAIGWAKGSTGSATGGLVFLGALTLVAFVLTRHIQASSDDRCF